MFFIIKYGSQTHRILSTERRLIYYPEPTGCDFDFNRTAIDLVKPKKQIDFNAGRSPTNLEVILHSQTIIAPTVKKIKSRIRDFF